MIIPGVIYERSRDFEEDAASALADRGADRVVLATGCFDLVHPGHHIFLEAAAEAGRRLVVGVNSDDSVRMLKGPGRPLQDETTRARALAELPMVDLVVVSEGRDAQRLLRVLAPDVFVVGPTSIEEYPEEAAAAREVGAEIVTVERRGDISTTRLISERGPTA